MEHLNKKLILGLVATAFLAGCGVKGRPIAPTNPPPMGRGQPTYKEKQKKKTDPSSPSASVTEPEQQ